MLEPSNPQPQTYTVLVLANGVEVKGAVQEVALKKGAEATWCAWRPCACGHACADWRAGLWRVCPHQDSRSTTCSLTR